MALPTSPLSAHSSSSSRGATSSGQKNSAKSGTILTPVRSPARPHVSPRTPYRDGYPEASAPRRHLYLAGAVGQRVVRSLYRFIMDAQVAADCEVANRFLCTHPTSFFRSNLLAERLTPECRLSLFNTQLTRTEPAGVPQIRFLTLASN